MKRIQKIEHLKPLKEFTPEFAKEQLAHINDDLWLYEAGKDRRICSLLGTLHEELADRPDLQYLVLEAVWMARRMNDTQRKQSRMWK